MTEAPDEYPETAADDGADAVDQGVEGRSEPRAGEVRTGDPRVDEVLESLEGLDERPVSEHAAVFENVHERLRAALEPDRETA